MTTANPWIRLHRASIHNPKIVSLSDRQHRAWHNCMLITDDGGNLPKLRDIAVHMRMCQTDAEQLIAELVEAGLIDAVVTPTGIIGYRMHDWDSHQFRSDNSTARSRKHRAKSKRNDAATLQERSRDVPATPPDTESDTDTERKDTPLPPLQGADPVELYEAIAAQKRPRQRGQRLSSDWQIPDGWRQWARVNCFAENAEITRQAEIFRDYWTAKPGAQAAKLDWEATWRNWCRRAFSPAGRHAGLAKPATTGTFTPKRQTFVDYDEENRRVAEMARKLVDAAVAGVTP